MRKEQLHAAISEVITQFIAGIFWTAIMFALITLIF